MLLIQGAVKLLNKKPLYTLILAAGKGTRMESDLPKVLHSVDGKPMLHHVIQLAKSIGSEIIIPIIGYQKERVEESIQDFRLKCVVQSEQLGTGHAVMQAESLLGSLDGTILVLSGDVPLMRESSIRSLLDMYAKENAGAALLTAKMQNPKGYGRIIRNDSDHFSKIVEHKDCTRDELNVNEINAGIYLFDAQLLFKTLKMIKNNNTQNEYYLPDVLPHFITFGEIVALQLMTDSTEIMGVNTVEQLKEINRIFKQRKK